MLTVDVAVATHRQDGIERVVRYLPAPQPGVRYVVSWQNHAGLPVPGQLLERSDVTVCRYDGVGVAANRNNALRHCSADVIVVGDDDVDYTRHAFEDIRGVFERDSTLDVATFESVQPVAGRQFPAYAVDLQCKLPRNYYVCAIEIAFRRSDAVPLFCEELTRGDIWGGEDAIFLASAIRRGLRCRFFPIVIAEHVHLSSGQRRQSDAGLRAEGVAIALTTPLTAIVRIPLKAWRLSRRKQSSFLKALRYMTAGALRAPGIRSRNGGSLWD